MFKIRTDFIPALIKEITTDFPQKLPRGNLDLIAQYARGVLGPRIKSKPHVLHVVEFIRQQIEGKHYHILNEQIFKIHYHKYLHENAVAANAIGGGAIAGAGVGSSGEPGVKPKNKAQVVLGLYRRSIGKKRS